LCTGACVLQPLYLILGIVFLLPAVTYILIGLAA